MTKLLQALDKAVELATSLKDQVVESFSDAALAQYAANQKTMEPEPKASTLPDKVRLFRHVRDGKVEDGKATISPSGGLSFYIEVNYPEHEITFATCVQSLGQNFQYRLGRNVSKGRFEHGQTLTGPYFADKSLIENVLLVLQDVNSAAIQHPEVYKMLVETKIDSNMLILAANMLESFTESLPREQPGDPK